MAATIVWFRQDLRLQDNAALSAAVKRGGPVIPVYVFDEAGEGRWPAGGAARWWLHHSLARLDESLRDRGLRLLLGRGPSGRILGELSERTKATAVFWNRRYEPAIIERDKAIKAGLVAGGLDARSFNSALLFEPHAVRNQSGGPFQVFTPFWRHCLSLPVGEPEKIAPGSWPAPQTWPTSLKLSDLDLLPKIAWDSGLAETWKPGEKAAQARLRRFLSKGVAQYDERRDFPETGGTSALSPHLHFGEIGPRQIWSALRKRSDGSGVFPANRGEMVFLKEIGWREFAWHLLYHFPTTPEQPLRTDFTAFPWVRDPLQLRSWREGATGYPIVDAGMRQLWRTGWMHNRVRMVVASFLVKHLRHSWREGAAWFWDTLVDADLANNTLGWQWSAGCGADAAPYFRIFNPTVQGAKFDPEGNYVRRWVPELKGMPAAWIHRPSEAPLEVLEQAGVVLGKTYPRPVVAHGEARVAALAALQSIRKIRPH